eukprot:INCI7769.1.p1 GENE.INCI7769.1~~INCI7769.1.p1  ORF type:complete len:382 (-),score=79.39 INCI7769.1:111-1256(-)
MLRNSANRRASSLSRRSSYAADNNADAENVAPPTNRRLSLHASPKRSLSSSTCSPREDMKKRARRKQKEREIKKMQQEKRALKKRHERIQQIAASNILDMQAKHDTLQRKVAEATRLEDYEKAKVMNEQIRALRLRVKAMQADLQESPENLAYLLEPKKINVAEFPSEQHNEVLAQSRVEANGELPPAHTTEPASTNMTPQPSHASKRTDAPPVASTSFFSPAPSQQGLAQPASSKPHASERRKSRRIEATSVSTRRASVAGTASATVGSESSTSSAAPASTPQSLKMDQTLCGGATVMDMADRNTPMAVPVVGYMSAGTPVAAGAASAVGVNPAAENINDALTASEAAVLEAAARINERRGRVQRRPTSTVDQKCQCSIM